MDDDLIGALMTAVMVALAILFLSFFCGLSPWGWHFWLKASMDRGLPACYNVFSFSKDAIFAIINGARIAVM